MNELFIYSLLMIISVFIASVSQIMLKLSTTKTYRSQLQEYLNPIVISAYALFLGCTFLTMYALKVVPLSLGVILEASGYIFVTVLSRMFLHEKFGKQKLLGLAVIMAGMLIYAL